MFIFFHYYYFNIVYVEISKVNVDPLLKKIKENPQTEQYLNSFMTNIFSRSYSINSSL